MRVVRLLYVLSSFLTQQELYFLLFVSFFFITPSKPTPLKYDESTVKVLNLKNAC